jgi:hypothetical protein
MCNISERRLLPKAPATNGQILVYNAATNRWEAQDNVGGGGGGGASFNPATNYAISGDWEFTKPIYQSEYTGGVGVPTNGYIFYSPEPSKIAKIFSTGFTITEDYSLLTADREIRFPDASGTLALRDVGMLRLPNTIDSNFQPVFDNNGNQSDLKISLTGINVTNLILENAAHFINFYGINTAGFMPNFAYNHGTGVVTNTGADFIWKSTGSLNNFEIDTANAFFGMGHNSPVKLGAALSTFQAANGVYFNASSGFQSDWANYAYTFNAPNHIFNAALSGSSLMNAGMLNLGSHTFGVQHASAANVGYRGINLGYSINNTVASNGVANGIRIDANIVNANGMVHSAFYYGVTGVSSNTINRGIELVNNDIASVNSQRLSPSIYLQGSGWKTNAVAGSQTIGYEIYLNPVQFSTSPIPQLNFDVIPEGSSRYTIFSIGGSTGINFNPQLSGMNPLITMGNVSLSFAGNCFTPTVGGPTTFNTNAFNLSSTQAWAHSAGERTGYNMNISFVTGAAGTGSFSAFSYRATISQGGGANGITRGVLINPVLTAAADFRAYEAIVRNNHSDKALLLSNGASELFVVYGSGRIKAGALPTSSVGLGSREFWIDGNTIRITD